MKISKLRLTKCTVQSFCDWNGEIMGIERIRSIKSYDCESKNMNGI